MFTLRLLNGVLCISIRRFSYALRMTSYILPVRRLWARNERERSEVLKFVHSYMCAKKEKNRPRGDYSPIAPPPLNPPLPLPHTKFQRNHEPLGTYLLSSFSTLRRHILICSIVFDIVLSAVGIVVVVFGILGLVPGMVHSLAGTVLLHRE